MSSVATRYRLEERHPDRCRQSVPVSDRQVALEVFDVLVRDDAINERLYGRRGYRLMVLATAPVRAAVPARPARAVKQRRICSRCGFPGRLVGRLVLAAASCEGLRWLCARSDACAARRRHAEALDGAA